MNIQKFWNTAFLNALTRLPVDEAKAEASAATEACVAHWDHLAKDDHIPTFTRQTKVSVTKAGRFKSRPSSLAI